MSRDPNSRKSNSRVQQEQNRGTDGVPGMVDGESQGLLRGQRRQHASRRHELERTNLDPESE